MPIPSSIPGLGELRDNMQFLDDFAAVMETEVIEAADEDDEGFGVSDMVEKLADCLDNTTNTSEECTDLLQQCFHGEKSPCILVLFF